MPEDRLNLTRRAFLEHGARVCLLTPFFSILSSFYETRSKGLGHALADEIRLQDLKDARYFISTQTKPSQCGACHVLNEPKYLKDKFEHDTITIRCMLCDQACLIKEGERGRCRARINVHGKLKSVVYGKPAAVHIDPIEKKPFYHFLPGSQAFSLGTAGCPLSCKFCQNWELSQAKPEDHPVDFISPEKLVDLTLTKKVPVIAFTYNEPTVFMEYLTDIARTAKLKGVRSVLISCGYMAKAPLDEMCDVLDAIKIDLKGYDNAFYKNVCGAELEPVLRSIKKVKRRGVHLEIVNLVVPSLNDSMSMLTELIKWVAGELGPDVPVHFTRFHPAFQMLNLPPTPVATLEKAYELAKKNGLNYPYVGNVPGHSGNHTICPGCGKVVITRSGFFINEMNVVGGCCKFCQKPIAGVWT